MTYKKEQTSAAETFFTDQQYYRCPDQWFRGNQQSRGHSTPNRCQGVCFICRKEGYCSWKHPQCEQDESKAWFKARNLCNFDPNTHNLDNKFNQAFRQYITDFEEDSDTDDDFTAALEALVTEDKGDLTVDQAKGSTQDSFFTSCSTLSVQIATETTQKFLNQACLYLLSTDKLSIDPTFRTEPETEVIDSFASAQISPSGSGKSDTVSRYSKGEFYRIIINTGATKRSTAGLSQFKAFQRLSPDITIDRTSEGKVIVQFRIRTTSSLGSAVIQTPIGNIEFHIMPANTLFLLSLSDIDTLGVYFNNLTNTLITPQGNVPVVRHFGHSFLLWDTSLQLFLTESINCFLTTTEL
jgi:hypothetical protein